MLKASHEGHCDRRHVVAGGHRLTLYLLLQPPGQLSVREVHHDLLIDVVLVPDHMATPSF